MNFDEIVVKESPGICRCCLSEGCYKDLGSEYIWMNEAEVYADMLLDCFDIGITQHSDGPNGAKRLICEVCITRLRDACNFKKQVLDSEKRFIDMLGRGEFRSKMVLFKPPMELKVESIEEPPEDVMAEDVEYLDDMEYEGNEEDVKVEGIQSTSRATTSEDRPLKRGRPKKDSSPTKAKRQKTVKGGSETKSKIKLQETNGGVETKTKTMIELTTEVEEFDVDSADLATDDSTINHNEDLSIRGQGEPRIGENEEVSDVIDDNNVEKSKIPTDKDDTTLISDEELELRQHGIHSEKSEIHPYLEFDWSAKNETFIAERENFTGDSGPTFPITDETRPVDIFYKIFDKYYIDLIVYELDRFVALRKTTKKKGSFENSWVPTNRDEIMRFFAFLILQGVYPKIKDEAYFSKDGFGTTPYFTNIMTYDRYLSLKTCLHLVIEASQTSHTTLSPMIQHFNKKFTSLYKPGQEITIVESLLMPRNPEFAYKVAITKPPEVGIKTYELYEASTGYLWKFVAYTEADTEDDNGTKVRQTKVLDRLTTNEIIEAESDLINSDNEEEENIIEIDGVIRLINPNARILYDLLEPLFHRGHTLLVTSNYLLTPLLSRHLKLEAQIDTIGPIRFNCQFIPLSCQDRELKPRTPRGGMTASFCSDLSLVSFRDLESKCHNLISTYHRHGLDFISIDDNDGKYKPNVILDYNKSMDGIERKHQYIAEMHQKISDVSYKTLFHQLFHAAVYNCYVIFGSNQSEENKPDHRQFRINLAEVLLKEHEKKYDLKTNLLTEVKPSPLLKSVTTKQKKSKKTAPKLKGELKSKENKRI